MEPYQDHALPKLFVAELGGEGAFVFLNFELNCKVTKTVVME